MNPFYNNDNIDTRNVSNVIKHMSNEELETILNDNQRITSLIKDLPKVFIFGFGLF